MQRMYETYGDIAEFRLVYITEAHASDSDWSVPYAKEKNITEHMDYGQRCTTADMLLSDKSLTIPTLIDGMDDAVNVLYSALPDRAFVVRTDGRLAVAAKRGPWGLVPALTDTDKWLTEFKETGKEPELVIPGKTQNYVFETSDEKLRSALGKWDTWIAYKNRQIEGEMIIGFLNGELAGEWQGMGQSGPIGEIQFDGKTLSFSRSMGERKMLFEGTVSDDKLEGIFSSPFGEMKTTGRRRSS